eukprot:COSAG02_NODE_24771_length_678_cov_0.886010_1_plen_91_part_10
MIAGGSSDPERCTHQSLISPACTTQVYQFSFSSGSYLALPSLHPSVDHLAKCRNLIDSTRNTYGSGSGGSSDRQAHRQQGRTKKCVELTFS